MEDGILVSWYVNRRDAGLSFSIHYVPPLKNRHVHTISSGGNEYPIKQMKANPYWDNPGFYRLSDLKWDSRRFRCMFDVPADQQNTGFRSIFRESRFPGHENPPRHPDDPDDYEGAERGYSLGKKVLCALSVSKNLQGPQTVGATDAAGELRVVDKPAVYIYVKAVPEDKDLILRGLLCERKRYGGWERGRYDYDGNGTLTGFGSFTRRATRSDAEIPLGEVLLGTAFCDGDCAGKIIT